MLPTVTATRYVAPLREGGSLPGVVEADDLGTYVCKFHGAGQGPRVLVAEVVVAGLARALDVPVPDLVVVRLEEALARYEADEEVQDLLRASVGDNLGVDLLPGSFGFDASCEPDADLAGRVLWLDALTANVDRSWRNPNLLVWHGDLWAIDHGASLWFHHGWGEAPGDAAGFVARAYDTADHVLGRWVAQAAAQGDALATALTPGVVAAAVEAVPNAWLGWSGAAPDALREAYVAVLLARLDARPAWQPGADR